MRALLLLLASCAYEAPFDTASSYPDAVTLTGEVVYSPDTFEPGVGHVLVYSALDLPPPNGFGRPVDLATISRDAWEGGSNGLRSAPWAISGLPSGSYLISVLVDNDKAAEGDDVGDFNPFYDFTAGATCGDTLGAWLGDLSAQEPAVLTVEAPDRVDGLSVIAAATLTTERPAFNYLGLSGYPPLRPSTTMLSLDRTNSSDLQFMFFGSVGIDHPLLTLNPPEDSYCPSKFFISLNDADGDGEVDPHSNPDLAALGLKDVWPKVYLIYAADLQGQTPDQTETTDDDGVWITEAVVVADLYMAPYGSAAPGDRFLSDSLVTVFVPAANHVYTDDSGIEVQEVVYGADMPQGLWATLVVEPNGQTWLVPNDAGDPTLAAAAGWEVITGQGPEALIPIQ